MPLRFEVEEELSPSLFSNGIRCELKRFNEPARELPRQCGGRELLQENFFSTLKKERIKRSIYPSQESARSNVFNFIEMFYNPVRRHSSAGDLSPVEVRAALRAKRFLSVYEALAGPGPVEHDSLPPFILRRTFPTLKLPLLLLARSCLRC